MHQLIIHIEWKQENQDKTSEERNVSTTMLTTIEKETVLIEIAQKCGNKIGYS